MEPVYSCLVFPMHTSFLMNPMPRELFSFYCVDFNSRAETQHRKLAIILLLVDFLHFLLYVDETESLGILNFAAFVGVIRDLHQVYFKFNRTSEWFVNKAALSTKTQNFRFLLMKTLIIESHLHWCIRFRAQKRCIILFSNSTPIWWAQGSAKTLG